MQYKKRNDDKVYIDAISENKIISCLYSKKYAKLLLNILVGNSLVSTIFGRIMDNKISKCFIRNFVLKNKINIEESEKGIDEFSCFNDFFIRNLKPNSRKINKDEDVLVSPADGKVLVYARLHKSVNLSIKGSKYTLATLLHDDELALKYEDCSVAIIRLSPTDYHRFHFPSDGYVSDTKEITGKYYSVTPVALKYKPDLYFENKRAICEIKNEKVQDFLFLEIGATMVGSIIQTHLPYSEIKKGDEKGYFKFGGSTVILIFQKDNILFDKELLDNTDNNYETAILMGESVGKIISK